MYCLKVKFFRIIQLITIWNWIPQRLSVHQPFRVFTTRENGTSVNTLLGVLNDMEYSIIVIKTFQNEVFHFCLIEINLNLLFNYCIILKIDIWSFLFGSLGRTKKQTDVFR